MPTSRKLVQAAIAIRPSQIQPGVIPKARAFTGGPRDLPCDKADQLNPSLGLLLMLHLQHTYVVIATSEAAMNPILETISKRRAVKVFEPVEIPESAREQILDAARHAPSSFNSQPYRFYWIETATTKTAVAELCMKQAPAQTASALVVVVADIGSLAATSQGQLQWMRSRREFSEAKIRDYERTAKIGRILFMPGPFGIFGAVKWGLFWLLNLCKVMGMPPTSRQDLFKWATKSTSLACENLMIAAEAVGINTCPMEGFDGRRLSKYLGLSARYHEIVMVIAMGKKSQAYVEPPQWRRPLAATVSIL
jgi:nitroreductase